MTEPRVFTRLRDTVPAGASGLATLPPGGMCLSVFLLLSPKGDPGRLLFGKIDPKAAWERIGNLDAARTEGLARAWMLPSSHLMRFESPDDAARRIALEQLELERPALEGPKVISEAYGRPGGAPEQLHWDLGFVYRGLWPEGRAVRARPFRELRFLDPRAPADGEIGRGHADIVRLAGP